jgi:CRP/FNR family transcriptional regulator, cyclic AMP receptor protein
MTTVQNESTQQSSANLDSMATIATIRRYRRGEVVAHAGDFAESLLVVVSGRLACRYQTFHGDQTLAGVSGPGAFVAAYSVLGTVKRHPATIVAMEDTVVRLLRADQFESFVREQPEILRVLATALANESARFGEQLNVAYWEKAEVRVRRNVCELAEMAWHDGPGPVSVTLTHEDVAAMAGVSRPTASTTIRSGVDAGVFRWGRGKLIVDELSRVRAWAS